MQFCLNAPPAVVSAPSSPERTANVFRGVHGFVSGHGSSGDGLPWLGVLARWDDSVGTTIGDRVGALARVVGAICRHATNLLILRNLAEKVRQHRRVADMASGDLDGSDLQRLLVDPEVDLAPDPPFGAAMLAYVPLAFALDLDAGAVDQQVQRPLGAAIRDVYGSVFWRRDSVLKLGTVTDAKGRPIRFFMSAGRVSDYTGAAALLDSLRQADWFLANRGYDADWLRKALQDRGIKACIPGRTSRKKTIQAPLQKAQSHRDHVRSSEGLETCRHTLRQVPRDIPLCNRIGRNRSVLAMIKNEP